MFYRLIFVCALILYSALPFSAMAAGGSGLPVPRFVSLKSDEVNVRTGPGTRYPISWVYKRRGLPVEIEREFDVWRLIRDADGTEGWVHEATLTGRRSLLVIGGERVLREAPADNAAIVARAGPGVVGRISHCAADSPWCEVEIKGYHGYLPRAAFWGSFPREAVN